MDFKIGAKFMLTGVLYTITGHKPSMDILLLSGSNGSVMEITQALMENLYYAGKLVGYTTPTTANVKSTNLGQIILGTLNGSNPNASIVGKYPIGTTFSMQNTKQASINPNSSHYFECTIISHDPARGNETNVVSSLSTLTHIDYFTDDEIFSDHIVGTLKLPVFGTANRGGKTILTLNGEKIGVAERVDIKHADKKPECSCSSRDLFNYGCKCGYLGGNK